MKTVSLCLVAFLFGLFTTAAYAQCADPPTSPRGRCIKDSGGSCDPARRIWVSPNDAVRRKCAPLSDKADPAAPAPRVETAPASPASTETAAAIFQRLKLIGKFAPDCSKPASDGNQHIVYRVAGFNRERVLREQFGNKPGLKVVVLRAFTEQNLVSFAAVREDNKPILSLWRVEGSRYRALRTAVDGNDVIKDGVLLAQGRETFWQNYCGPA